MLNCHLPPARISALSSRDDFLYNCHTINVLKYETTELSTMKCTYRHNIRSTNKEKYVSGKSQTNKQTNIEVRKKERKKTEEKKTKTKTKNDQVDKARATGSSLNGCPPCSFVTGLDFHTEATESVN